MSIDHAVVADIKSTRLKGRLILEVYVHAGRSRALTWRLQAEVESRGGRSTTQQAGLTNGLQTGPVCTLALNEDVVGLVELEVSEDNVQLAHLRLPLTG
ncbi:hypothetical protein [Aquidulcibacter sp.]|uniref:hypothetical protein n=1 Tax=Aquidulcibacter sp. TaxID=2052990 RepID=UPI0025BF729E|nr:hypothetical protein [Aquidulcibacter sp.]MCA3694078.1 hypothetical protein [Aquidulcibacter sp.]